MLKTIATFLCAAILTACVTRTVVQPVQVQPPTPTNAAQRFVDAVSPDAQYVTLGKDTVLLREGEALAICYANEKHKTQCHNLADWGANPPKQVQPPPPAAPAPAPAPEPAKAEPPKAEPKKAAKK